MSGSVFDTRRHSNVKTKPEYRRVGVYYKSVGKFKEEELRRNRVLEMHLTGFSVREIAVSLGVCERTVNRDLSVKRVSVKRAFSRCIRSLAEEERLRVLDELEGLSPVEAARLISQVMKELANRKKNAKIRSSRKILVTIDVEAARSGRPALKFKPSAPVHADVPGVLTLRLLEKSQFFYVGQIAVG